MPSTSSTTIDVLRIFDKSIKGRWWQVAVICVSVVVVEIVDRVVVPWYFKIFFDRLSSADIEAGPQVILPALTHSLFIIALLWFTAWIFWRVVAFTDIPFVTHVTRDIYIRSFNYLLRHSHQFFVDSFAGALVRRINRLVKAFEAIADHFEYHLLPLAVNIFGILIAISFRSRLVALILLIWLVVFISFNYFFALWKLKYDVRKAEKDSEVTGCLSDAIANSSNVQLFSGFRSEESLFEKVTDELRRLRSLTWIFGETNFAVQALMMSGLHIGVLFISLKFWVEGKLTLGDFVLFQTYLGLLFHRTWDLHRTIRHLYESFADAKEMVDILNTPHEISDRKSAKALQVSKGRIEFQSVVFNYRKTRKILDGLDLQISPREKIALVGPSGAGKSTLVKLLFRLYDIDKGKILIDGQNISAVTQDSLHDAIALVPQDPALFHRSLMENIRYGRRDASDEEVMEAAKKAHCHEFISELSEGYETLVGERGIKLSGGERQRVAIARAILKDAPILVLDEAISSLDSESESLIQDALRVLMKDKTVIVIAHRLSTIIQMDRIIVMEKGKVVDIGTHEELMKKVGIYQKLWNIQAGGFGVDDR